VVSDSLKRDTLEHFEITNDIEVIPNFIRHDKYTAPPTEKCQKKEFAPNGERIVVHISNFRKVKRVEDVLYTFKKINDKIPSKLLLVGDGPERMKLENLCSELNICGDVKMLGKIRNVADVLCISDLFILPSVTESFGLAALEALASRVPVISTNTGGLPEVNKHGYSGFLSAVADINDMAKNALTILKDDDTLEKFKEQAYEHSLNFGIHKIVPQYEKLYKRLINEKI
jgi:N-acetyl-alpha-D-glucosaminyl L-malate synthase BshA